MNRWIIAIATVLLFAMSPRALANTIAGNIRYEDRTYNRTGFTGTQMLPARYARVRVQVGNPVTETVFGGTDENGDYSIAVTDAGMQRVIVTVFSQSPDTLDNGDITVYDDNEAVYGASVTENDYQTTGGGNPDIDFDVMMADGDAANALNIFDCLNFGHDYLTAVAGGVPVQPIAARWEDGLNQGTFYDTDLLEMTLNGTAADDDSYDDDITLHEFGHHVMNIYSTDDSPGGSHSVTEDDQDVRLAFSEGAAHYWSAVIRQFRGDAGSSNPTDQVDNFISNESYFNLEDFGSSAGSLADSSTEIDSELAVCVTLWDIVDNDDTADFTPGTDDDAVEITADAVDGALVAGANGVDDGEDFAFHVFDVRIPAEVLTSPVQRTLENFFWLWFSNDGSYNNTGDELQTLFGARGMDYAEDGAEPDQTTGAAFLVDTDGTEYPRTFFDDDTLSTAATADLFRFVAVNDGTYQVTTSDLLNNGDTRIYITTDGTAGGAVAQNADINGNANVASQVTWNNDSGTGTYYILVQREQSGSATRNQARSRLGAYTLSVLQTAGPDGPDATVDVDVDEGVAPVTVGFVGDGDAVSGSEIVRYEYDFDGNGIWDFSSATSGLAAHTYTYAGIFEAVFRVTDSNGLTAIDTVIIAIDPPATAATLDLDIDGDEGFMQGDGEVTLTATVDDLPAGTDILFYQWDFDGDGVMDVLQSGPAAIAVQNYRYPTIDQENFGGEQEFTAMVFAVLRDSEGAQQTLVADGELTVLANPLTPNITDFTADDLSGFALFEPEFDCAVDFDGTSNILWLDIDGDGQIELVSGGLGAGVQLFTFEPEYSQGGVFRPRLFARDIDNGLYTRARLDNAGGEDIIVSVFDPEELLVSLIAPEAGDSVAGLVTLIAEISSGGSLITNNLSNVSFQYRPTGVAEWADTGADVVRNGSLLKALFDMTALGPGQYDFAVLIGEETDARDDSAVLAVNLLQEVTDPDDLDQFPAGGTQLAFADENGNPDQYFEVETGPAKQVFDGLGNGVFLPVFALTVDPVTVRIHVLAGDYPADAEEPLPAGVKPADILVDFSVLEGEIQDEGAAADLQLPIRLRIAYPDADQDGVLDTINMHEEDIQVFFYDEADDVWLEETNVVINAAENFAEVTTAHLTIFGLFGHTFKGPVFAGGGGASACFIATAAYGTPFEPEVDNLRHFRDEVLAPSETGERLVELYYENSPAVADTIRDQPVLRAVVRRWLRPLSGAFAPAAADAGDESK